MTKRFVATFMADGQPDDIEHFDQFTECFNWAKNHQHKQIISYLRIEDMKKDINSFWKIDAYDQITQIKYKGLE